MPYSAATISADEGTCGGDGEANSWPIWDRIPSLYEKPHTKREKLHSTRTGHRCSHFAVHCSVAQLVNGPSSRRAGGLNLEKYIFVALPQFKI
jgi:hypothetical protein